MPGGTRGICDVGSRPVTGPPGFIDGACRAQLGEHFSDAEIVELTFIVGYQTFASKFAKAFRLAPQGFSSVSAT